MALRDAIVAQFGHPRGVIGRLAGAIMAVRPSNRERNLWVVSLLDIQPDDRVLEIGFGPGVAIAAAAAKITIGTVVGVDHSEVMVEQASRRNRAAIAAQRVRLIRGGFEVIPPLAFTKVFAVNSFGFWKDKEADLKRIRRAMSPGGVLAIATQPRSRGATDATAAEAGAHVAKAVAAAGFRNVRVETRSMKPVATVCVLATLP